MATLTQLDTAPNPITHAKLLTELFSASTPDATAHAIIDRLHGLVAKRVPIGRETTSPSVDTAAGVELDPTRILRRFLRGQWGVLMANRFLELFQVYLDAGYVDLKDPDYLQYTRPPSELPTAAKERSGTPLQRAIMDGTIEVIELLLAAGANPLQVPVQDTYLDGETYPKGDVMQFVGYYHAEGSPIHGALLRSTLKASMLQSMASAQGTSGLMRHKSAPGPVSLRRRQSI